MSNLHIDILQEYVDGELESRERLELARHLGHNLHDRALVEAYQALNDALGLEYSGKLHEPVPERIQSLIDGAGAGALVQPEYTLTPSAPGNGEAATQDDGALDALVRQAVQAFEFYADTEGQPLTYEAERVAEFFGWLERRLQVKVRVPALDELGFSLLCARLLPMVGGTAGQVLYGDAAGRRLAVYFQIPDRRASAGETANPVCIQQDRLAIYYWQHGGVDYALVATMNLNELAHLARSMVLRSAP